MNRSHPLRRPSTGSLSSLARSTDRNTASPSGLDFLQPALLQLSDEASDLASHISQLTALHNALGTFNESFAGYMYALKMNAFCVEWMQGPNEDSFPRLESLQKQLQDIQHANDLTEQQAHQQHSSQIPLPPSPTHQSSGVGAGDMTYATVNSEDQIPKKGKAPVVVKKQTAAGAAAAKKQALSKKKQRQVSYIRELRLELMIWVDISAVVDTLPLEYRGNQPDLRFMMEKVISNLMDSPEGLPLKAIVSPTLPQAKVNKCLIALVAKKLVTKANIGGTAFYVWAA